MAFTSRFSFSKLKHPLLSSHFMACLPKAPFMHSVQHLETTQSNKRERAALWPCVSGIRVKVCPSLWQQRMSENERWNKDRNPQSLTWDDTRRVNNSSSTCVDSSHGLSVMQSAVNISAHRTLKHYLCMGRARRSYRLLRFPNVKCTPARLADCKSEAFCV